MLRLSHKHAAMLPQSQDDATDDRGLSRPNIMAAGYISADVVDPFSPQGGRTAGAAFDITKASVTVVFTSGVMF